MISPKAETSTLWPLIKTRCLPSSKLRNLILPLATWAGLAEATVFVVVEKDRRKHYVAQVKLNEQNREFNVTIPEMPEQSYGVLIDHRRCDSGKIIFELFGEKREELVPLADPVALPAGSFTIYFQKYNSAVQKQVDLSIKEDDVIELCDIIR